jgi:ATP-dependent exoDNAse (exonuclease V) beta subunit
VDYKTDTYVPDEVLHAYEAQVRVYAEAVIAAIGRPAEPCLLFI